MNVQKKQTRFRDDLRRLLLIYALLPLFCALLVVFAVMGGLFISNIIHRMMKIEYRRPRLFPRSWRRSRISS